MADWLRISLLCWLVAAVVLIGSAPLDASWQPPYAISKYEINLTLLENGDATVKETIRYQIQDDLRDFTFYIHYDGVAGIALTRIGVTDQKSGTGQAIFIEAVPATDKQSNKAMTYELKDDGDKVTVRLITASSIGTTRTICLMYTLRGAVKRHQDAALLQRRFFRPVDPVAMTQPKLSLLLPRAIPATQIWSMPTSLADFVTAQPVDNLLVFQSSRLAADQDLYLTCVFPDEPFALTPLQDSPSTWAQLTLAARAADARLHQNQSRRRTVGSLVFILIALAALIGFMVYWFFDREGAAIFRLRYNREIPLACRPAVLALLLHKRRPAQLILALLLDLVQRGELKLDGYVLTWMYPDRQDYTGFSASEVYLLQWFFRDITREPVLSIAQVRRYARSDETARTFQIRYRKFRELLDEERAVYGFLDLKKTLRGRLYAGLTALVYLILTVLVVAFLKSGTGLLLLLPSLSFLLYSRTIRRLTIQGREVYAQGVALVRYFGRMDTLTPLPDAEFVNQALPYAMANGLTGAFLALLSRISSSRPDVVGLKRYGLGGSSKPLPERLQILRDDLKAMESMLSASLLLAERVHL